MRKIVHSKQKYFTELLNSRRFQEKLHGTNFDVFLFSPKNLINMENKAVGKPRTSWPSVFDGGWMERFFNAPLNEFSSFGKVMNAPAVNVSETDKEYKLNFAAPGLDKSDFKVEVMDDMLTISAEKTKEEKEENSRYNRREYNYASWSRSFNLPDDCESDKVDAKYENGELKITIPKTAGKQKKNVHNITIN